MKLFMSHPSEVESVESVPSRGLMVESGLKSTRP